MAFTNVKPARRGKGDFFPVPKRPYTRNPPARRGLGDFPTIGQKPPPKVDPYSFGPRQPNMVGVGAQAPNTPQGPSQSAATASAAAGAKADALAAYVAGISDPKERAYVEAQIGPQIAALNAQRDAYAQQAKAQQEAAQGFTAALIDHLNGLAGSISGPYAEIANSQVAAGKAAGDSLAAANPQGGTAAILQAIGAPESQVADLEKLNRDVFSGGGAVLTGTGGTLPSFQTAGEGVGVLGYAAAQPGIAAAYGQENMRQLLGQQAQQEQQYQSDLQSILAGIPKAQQDFQSQQQSAEQAAEQKAMSLYNSGLITQRQLAHQLNLPNWQKYPDQPRGSATAPKIIRGADGANYAYDASTGKMTQLTPGKAPTAPVAKPPKTFGSSSTGIYAWQQTATGWKPVQIVAPTAKAGAAAKHPTTVSLPNGNLAVWQQTKNGWKLVTIASKGNDPSKPVVLGAGGVPMTNSQINDAGATVRVSIASARKKGIKIEQVLDTFANEGIPAEIYAPLVAKQYGIPLNLNAANLKNMTVERLRRTAAFLGWRPSADMPQRKVNGKTVRGYSKQEFVQWIQSHLPKAEAAAQAAYNLPANASSQFSTVDAEGAPDASGTRHHAAYDWMLGANAAVPALAGGTVIDVAPSRGTSGQIYGGVVKIQMANGRVIVYRHVNPNVKVGQKIAEGQSVAKVTRWSDNPSSSHTHVELWKTRNGGYRYENMLDPLQEFGGSAAVPGANRPPAPQMALAQKYGQQYGVDPKVLLAIAGHETHFGSLGAGRNGYTLGYGVTDSGTLTKYRGVANQYRYAAQLLARWGVRTIQDITNGKASRYASDPSWERGVASVYGTLV